MATNIFYTPGKGELVDKPLFIPPPPGIKFTTFGFNELLADSLWLRWIQSPAECGKGKIPRSVFEKNYTGYKIDQKNMVKLNGGWDRSQKDVCVKGWSFQMLDAITTLAPRFRMPYVSGPIILSVLADDHEGAKILFERAVEQFPLDWKFHYQAAYHYLFELDDVRRAADHLYKASNLGAPQWTKSLAARLYTKVGQAALGIIALKQYRLVIEDDKVALKEVNERLAKLEKILVKSKKKNR